MIPQQNMLLFYNKSFKVLEKQSTTLSRRFFWIPPRVRHKSILRKILYLNGWNNFLSIAMTIKSFGQAFSKACRIFKGNTLKHTKLRTKFVQANFISDDLIFNRTGSNILINGFGRCLKNTVTIILLMLQ